MKIQSLAGRQKIFVAALILLAIAAVCYTGAVVITDGIGTAFAPILGSIILCFNCFLLLTGRIFPPAN